MALRGAYGMTRLLPRIDFDRMADDQIALTVEGQWRSYSLTLAWSPREEVLRLVCSFDMDPPEARLGALYEVLLGASQGPRFGSFAAIYGLPMQVLSDAQGRPAALPA